jgi:membrane protein YqaA with SNARE-associated domain
LGILSLFSWCYDHMQRWSHHPHAPYYLAGVSFIESSVFPIPPDVMLISMGLAKPYRAWTYAFIATIASVLGGLFGYGIGYFIFHLISPYLDAAGYTPAIHHVMDWFKLYGVWVVFVAGFSPIPYKLFTLAAGALHMALLPFVVASLLGRGARFYLVSGLLFYQGAAIEKKLRPWIDWLGWATVGLIILGYCIIKWVF